MNNIRLVFPQYEEKPVIIIFMNYYRKIENLNLF